MASVAKLKKNIFKKFKLFRVNRLRDSLKLNVYYNFYTFNTLIL